MLPEGRTCVFKLLSTCAQLIRLSAAPVHAAARILRTCARRCRRSIDLFVTCVLLLSPVAACFQTLALRVHANATLALSRLNVTMIVSAADLGQLLQQDWHRFCHLPQQFLRFFVALLWELRWAAQYAGFSSETYLPAYAVDVGMLLQGLGPNDGLYGWKRFLRPSARWLGLGSRCDLPALLCATSWTCVMMRWIQCTRFSRVLWTLPRMPLLPLLRTDVAGELRWSHSPSKTHEKKKKAIDKKLQQG